MATEITPNPNKIYVEGSQFRNAVSEELIQRMGGSVNWLIDNLDSNIVTSPSFTGNVTNPGANVEVQIGTLSVPITTSGRPLQVMLVSDLAMNPSPTQPPILSGSAGMLSINASNVQIAHVFLKRGSTYIGSYRFLEINTGPYTVRVPVSTIASFDSPPAGTYTYSATVLRTDNLTAFTVENTRLLVREIL